MAKPIITAQRLRELVSYDSDTGVMLCLTKRAMRCPAGSPVGNPSTDGHLKACFDGRMYLVHRLAWLYAHGEWPRHNIDHINGDPVDNRLGNLRDVPQRLNNQNQRKAQRKNRTGYLGVQAARYKGRFFATLNINGKVRMLGYFNTALEAHECYVDAKRLHHEGCTL